jgi:ketosteroid isomerase-like protein
MTPAIDKAPPRTQRLMAALEEELPATDEDVVRLRAAYDALRSGDVIPLVDMMDENIRWIGDRSLGDPPPECNGRDEASSVLKRAVDRMPARDIESVAIAGDRILSVARWHEGHGPPGVDRIYNLLTMRDGRIVKMQDFLDRAAAERAFSSTELSQSKQSLDNSP